MRKLLLIALVLYAGQSFAQINYRTYHQTIIKIEEDLVNQEFTEVHQRFQSLVKTYDFIFLRDLKIAAQVAAIAKDSTAVLDILNQALSQGWKIKHIKKTPLLSSYTRLLKTIEPAERNPYYYFIDSLFRKDQKMALKAFLKVRESARQKFYDTKFAPHSKRQLQTLLSWQSQENEWPGEQHVGNGYMASAIVSHHNSISPSFNNKDTLFHLLDLEKALDGGSLSPFHYALMHDWRNAISYQDSTQFGYVGQIFHKEHLDLIEEERARIGLRSIKLRNQLIELERASELKLFLPGSPWQTGVITPIDQK